MNIVLKARTIGKITQVKFDMTDYEPDIAFALYRQDGSMYCGQAEMLKGVHKAYMFNTYELLFGRWVDINNKYLADLVEDIKEFIQAYKLLRDIKTTVLLNYQEEKK